MCRITKILKDAVKPRATMAYQQGRGSAYIPPQRRSRQTPIDLQLRSQLREECQQWGHICGTQAPSSSSSSGALSLLFFCKSLAYIHWRMSCTRRGKHIYISTHVHNYRESRGLTVLLPASLTLPCRPGARCKRHHQGLGKHLRLSLHRAVGWGILTPRLGLTTPSSIRRQNAIDRDVPPEIYIEKLPARCACWNT